MAKIVDLHTHTSWSDGIKEPAELVALAESRGISLISITDHDTVNGIEPAIEAAKHHSVEILPGIELSCHEMAQEYHILGYNIDISNQQLRKKIEEIKHQRIQRAEQILKKLSGFGINLEMDWLFKIAGKAVVGRPHIAQLLLDKGFITNFKDGFTYFLHDRAAAYVPKTPFPVDKGIELINKAGGVAVLAHPANSVNQQDLYKMIKYGLDGIEIIHPSHTPYVQKYYHNIASQYWLLETGGSDYHGNREYDDVNFGKFWVPYSVVETILKSSVQR